MSNKCKTLCIDEGKNFCPSADHDWGTCYESNERPTSKADFCSEDNPNAPSFFKYLTCPNEAACGTMEISPSYSGEILYRAIDSRTHKFVKEDVCSYIIKAPKQMTEYDKLHLKIIKLDKAAVYVAKGKWYFWLNHLDTIATRG